MADNPDSIAVTHGRHSYRTKLHVQNIEYYVHKHKETHILNLEYSRHNLTKLSHIHTHTHTHTHTLELMQSGWVVHVFLTQLITLPQSSVRQTSYYKCVCA